MSENENKPPEDGDEQAAATAGENAGAVAPVAMAPPAGRAAAAAPAPRRAGGSLVGWLALLLVLALAAGVGWSLREALQRGGALQARVAALEAGAYGERDDLAQVEGRWREELAAASTSLSTELADQGARLEAISRRMDSQSQLLESFSANDQDTWLRAEAQYLLRLANQRVLMARDPASALALLHSADGILRELDDPALHEVRGAVAAEMAALRAVPTVDVEGIYLRISALIEQAGMLRIFELPEHEALPATEPAEDWRVRLERGYEEAAHKLSEYIVIRRRDVPMQALMDPQWEGLVRQNLRMLLEQAQVALLSGNQPLYRESLERARLWVLQFADSDPVAANAMDTEIQALQGETIVVEIPDLSRSLQALDAEIRRHPQQGGAG